MAKTKTDILILGGGFAGIRAAHLLGKQREALGLSITLIDRESCHTNTPILYEIASAFVPWEKEGVGQVMHEVAGVPFREVLDGTGATFFQGNVERIRPDTRTVYLSDGQEHTPDILLCALGVQTHTFGIPGATTNAFGVKTIHEAAELRHHIVSQFLRHRSAARRIQERAFTVVVAGGGSSGVETAAEMVFFLRKLAKLHRVSRDLPRVVLYEAGDMILREYPVSLREKGIARLKKIGVDIHTKCAITVVQHDHVELASGEQVPTNTLVWVGGTRAHDVFLRSGLPLHPRGGLIVDETLEVHGCKNIFAAGDTVYMTDPATGSIVPDVAWAAIQQGNVAACNIIRRVTGEPLVSYRFHARPTLATVGGKYALANIPPLQIAGRTGWFLKQLVDLFYLMSILPNGFAFRSWWKSVRVRVANDPGGLPPLS